MVLIDCFTLRNKRGSCIPKVWQINIPSVTSLATDSAIVGSSSSISGLLSFLISSANKIFFGDLGGPESKKIAHYLMKIIFNKLIRQLVTKTSSGYN